MSRILFTILALALAVPVAAQEFEQGPVIVEHPRVPQPFAMARAAAGYMTIRNAGAQDEHLVGVRIEGRKATLHESRESDGVMRMVPLDSVEIPAGGSVEFAPGGLHVMIMGFEPGELEPGGAIDATLVFDRAGEMDIFFIVEEGDAGDGAGHMHGRMMTN